MGGRGAPREASADEARVLAAVEGELNRSFDEASDLPLLKRLWVAAQGDEAVPFERTGEAWTQFGFQQEDPISDLRGGGVLGLANLVAFLERSPFFARPIMASRRPAAAAFDPEQPGFYPFACAGINVTLALCEFAGLRGPGGAPKPAARPELSFWPLLAGDGAAWDAAYAVGFRLLDRSFDSKRASYMDFNAVRKEAVADLRAALERAAGDGPAARYVRGAVDPRPPCGHDGLAKGLKLAPHGWGATAPARSGALEKLPVSGLVTSRKVSKWKRRHFVLRGDVVAWFKPVGDRPGVQASPAAAKADAAAWAKAEVHGELTNATRLTADSGIRPGADATAFKVERCANFDGSKGKLRLKASSANEARAWMAAIEKAIAAAAGRTCRRAGPRRPGWAARVDARSGHTYDFFPPTGETTWTLPER
ncbi:ELMO domain-containing protein [Aureococcus anophagefferens]|nr:ELMO domain-containing protein [Aureococcus anophagefferens]